MSGGCRRLICCGEVVMRPLWKKLVRELFRLKGQMVAVAAVVMCGISVFVSMSSLKYSLMETRERYYNAYRFADVFMQLKRAPEWYRERVRALPGVATVSTRIVADVTLDVPGLDEPATGRLISVPGAGIPVLNDVFVAAGRMVEPDRDDEVVASRPFMEANRLELGDRVVALIDGRKKSLRIVGVGLSPEYVYEVQPGSFFPDRRRFGVFWMNRRALASALDMTGAFNDLSLRLTYGASEKDVLMQLDRMFASCGSLGAYGRNEQLSDRFLADEIRQVGIQITFLPVVFLSVAVFLLHVVLRRLVATERDQIAVLKAIGYTDSEVGFHYLWFALVPTLIGAIAGTALGWVLGRGLVTVYGDFYNFAGLVYLFRFRDVALSGVLSVAAAVAGALGAVRRVVQLPPAEAMRPEAPVVYRPGFLDGTGVPLLLPVPWRLVLRSIGRRPFRALVSVVMIALAVAILVAGRFSYDALERMVSVEFRDKHREQVTLVFNAPVSPMVLLSLGSLDGVLAQEPYREEVVRIRSGHRSRRQSVRGVVSTDGLQRLVDENGRQVPLSPDGLVLSETLAKGLGVRAGDVVRVEFLQGRQLQRMVRIDRTVDDVLGMSATMSLEALNRLAGDGGAVNAVWLRIDQSKAAALYARLKELSAVSGITMLEAILESFNRVITESMMTSTVVLTAFASVLAFAVVYNGARISFSERMRELSSLRVIGLTKQEVSVVLLGEQIMLTLVALPLGLLFGVGLSVLLAMGLSSELYRLPLVFTVENFLFAVGVVLLVSVVSGLLVRRQVRHLDLVEVLKTRE